MNIPFAVSESLYFGICARIEHLEMAFEKIRSMDEEEGKRDIVRRYKAIQEAIAFYDEHCMISSVGLHDNFRELLDRQPGIYLIWMEAKKPRFDEEVPT